MKGKIILAEVYISLVILEITIQYLTLMRYCWLRVFEVQMFKVRTSTSWYVNIVYRGGVGEGFTG